MDMPIMWKKPTGTTKQRPSTAACVARAPCSMAAMAAAEVQNRMLAVNTTLIEGAIAAEIISHLDY
ncbi:hypothetical protein [Paraburkholderia fungorum]|uniref:hypothetical protein n=1 Tax=Paraburkholderia fungorum TaxID=134537 RepID=UPI00115FB7B3|nr:hypothetical protein [Paraburkholderia fungorum]